MYLYLSPFLCESVSVTEEQYRCTLCVCVPCSMDEGVWNARDEVSFGTEEKGSTGKIEELHIVEFLQTLLVWLTESERKERDMRHTSWEVHTKWCWANGEKWLRRVCGGDNIKTDFEEINCENMDFVLVS
jgi:hypothetical protein